MTAFEFEHTAPDASRFAITWDELDDCDSLLRAEPGFEFMQIATFDNQGLCVFGEYSDQDVPIVVVRELMRRLDRRNADREK